MVENRGILSPKIRAFGGSSRGILVILGDTFEGFLYFFVSSPAPNPQPQPIPHPLHSYQLFTIVVSIVKKVPYFIDVS